MRRVPLVLAVLFALLLAGLAWFTLGQGKDGGAAAPTPEVRRAAQSAQGQTPAEPSAESAPAAPATADGAAAGLPARSEAAAQGALAGGERAVHGRVELTLDCRREDGLTVYALDRKATIEELGTALFIERHGEEPGAAEEEDEDDDEEEDEDTSPPPATPRILARAAVESSGSFELRLDAEAPGSVHLLALGRFAYLADSLALTLSGPRTEVALGLACGAEISGLLVPPQGTAVAELEGTDLRVRLAVLGRPEGRLSRAARADAAGRFSIGGLPARLELELLARPEAHPYARQTIGHLEAGVRREVRVELVRGARVIGVVLDAEGRPVKNARVALMPEGSLFDLGWSARTKRCDGEGRFDIAGLASGGLLVRGSARGYLESETQRIDLEEGGTRSGLELRLASGASIAGRVRWPDGRPAQDARVGVRFDPAQSAGMGAYGAMRGARGESRSDEEGNFRVGGLGRGPFVLRVECAPPADLAEGDDDPWIANVASMPPDGPELDLVLSAPAGVRGQVLDVEDAPLERFQISAFRITTSSGVELGVEELDHDFEDPTGHFRFGGLGPGKWRLYAQAEGYARGGPVQLDIPQPKEAEPVLFRLQRSARVEGIVLGYDGRPVSEAEVSVADDQPAFMRMIGSAPDLPSDRTDPSGRFRIDDLPPGSVSLVAKAEGYASSLPKDLDLAPGEEGRGVELVLREGGRIEGQVFNAEGRPASGATVQLLHTGIMDWRFERTDGEGRFQATRLDPGTWRALYMPRGFGTESLTSGDAADLDMGELMRDMAVSMADVEDGQTVHIVLGAPPEDPVRLRGRVLLAGDPYPGAVLAFYREGTKALERMRASSSKEDGSFEVLLDAPGVHLVQIQKMGGTGGQQSSVELTIDVPKVAEHELALELPGGRISGRLRNADGDAAGDVRVTLVGAGAQDSGFFFGGHYSEILSDAQGAYEIVGLRPGAYQLAVGGMTAGGFFGSDASHARELRRVEIGRDEHARDVDFRLSAPGKLSVKVVDEIGEPVSEAAIFVREAQSGEMLERFSLLTTGAQGLCEYGGLAEGRYTVSARKGGRVSQETAAVTVRRDGESTVQVVLEEGTLLKLELLDEEGLPLRADYSVRDADGREYQGLFAMEDLMEVLGKVDLAFNQPQVGPLPPGEYRVEARSADGRSAERPVSLRGQSERILRLRLR